MSKKLWGGRFTGKTDPLMEQFNASIGFDRQLWQADIRGSQAYARALARAGLLTEAEAEQLVTGLEQVADEWAQGTFTLVEGDEDIHTANERRLTELVGAVGGKLHTGRSRNDQVATDVRLWLRDAIIALARPSAAVDRRGRRPRRRRDRSAHARLHSPAAGTAGALEPLAALAHLGLAARRPAPRRTVRRASTSCRWAAGALAGNPFAIDRHALAADLGFADITYNSLDGVADRDFIAEFLFWATLTMLHLSRFAEDLIIYSSREFGFVAAGRRLQHGQQPDAAEEEPRRARTAARQVGPRHGPDDGADDSAQGAADVL